MVVPNKPGEETAGKNLQAVSGWQARRASILAGCAGWSESKPCWRLLAQHSEGAASDVLIRPHETRLIEAPVLVIVSGGFSAVDHAVGQASFIRPGKSLRNRLLILTGFSDFSVDQLDYPIRFRGQGLIVSHHHHREVLMLSKRGQRFHYVATVLGIEVAGRLIG